MGYRILKLQYGLQCVRNRTTCLNKALFHSVEEPQEEPLPYEWYEKAFSKLTKLSQLLKHLDFIDGKLVDVSDHSVVTNKRLEARMHTFKSLSRAFIGYPSVLKVLNRNIMPSFAAANCTLPSFFGKPNERQLMIVDTVSQVCNFLKITAQQRKVVRLSIWPQITQHQIWTGALEEILNGLKFELDILNQHLPSEGSTMGEQIVGSCLKVLDAAISYDPESTSWMHLTPTKVMDSCSQKWGDVLEMFSELIVCLKDRKQFILHFTKLEAMKEGLHQIKDVSIDTNVGYKDMRRQESLGQKKLMKTLGQSSRCLFILLLYYLYGNVQDVEVELSGGLCEFSGTNKQVLYMGKILTSDDEKMVRIGVKQLDKALGLFEFMWKTAGIEANLQLQGHLLCIGAESRSLLYRGNVYFVHGITL